ncbi:MAG: SDR family oxidoreductase, partial [bacterium]
PFKDKVVLVTGASRGIGRAIALQLAREGALLALAARNRERLEGTAAQCRLEGAQALALVTDVSHQEECRTLVERTLEAYGRLEMLVNNAGFGVQAGLAELPDPRSIALVLAVNFLGAATCTFYALPHLKRSRGRIVAVSSLNTLLPAAEGASYVASKAAMNGFFDSLRLELHGTGVSVTVVNPGLVRSEFHESMQDAEGLPYGARGRAMYGQRTMTSEAAAAIILRAAAQRRREIRFWPGTLLAWLRLLAPGLLDRIILQVGRGINKATGGD